MAALNAQDDRRTRAGRGRVTVQQEIAVEVARVKAMPVEPGPEAAMIRAQRSGVTYRAEQAIQGQDATLIQQCLADLRAIA